MANGGGKTSIKTPQDVAFDFDGYPGVPSCCLPDLLATWDFLCTFHRTLSLEPIALDDFVAALTFCPISHVNKKSESDNGDLRNGHHDGNNDNPEGYHIPVFLTEVS